MTNSKKIQMFCISLEPSHFNFIKSMNYIPVGLGEKKFNDGWMGDKTGNNISKKNKNYGEYTFHYWIWKNYMEKLSDNWIGFCQYRKFWTTNNFENTNLKIDEIPSITLKYIPEKFENYDVILGEPFYINQRRIMKFFKKGFKLILKNPALLFSKKQRNIKFHFDLMHGENNLYKAIDLLDDKNRDDFKKYVNSKEYFHPQNMFICKSKKLLLQYYETIFPWLEKCEKIFPTEKLKGYDLTRIYGFLAERFLSYWFQKNANCTTMNITFYDIRNDIKDI
tara:strand:+ start:176 stop:1012 length:837 start_codon:yes stop_codon:yes gene_type:complete